MRGTWSMAIAVTLRAASRSTSALFLPGHRNAIEHGARLEPVDLVLARRLDLQQHVSRGPQGAGARLTSVAPALA